MRLTIGGGATLALLGSAGAAAAGPGVTLFGEARLGFGYNIDNEGDAAGDDDLRAISEVVFGGAMSGETPGGIVFGAAVQTDEAEGGEGGRTGQTAGEVFVAGPFGALAFGDTNGADAQHVGDLNEVGLTCLGCDNETPFISNGGGFGEDNLDFADDPLARPTLRYDLELGDLGVSLSTDRDLADVGVGASWSAEVGEASVTVGAGYYGYGAFTALASDDDLEGGALEPGVRVPAGRQWSAALGGEFGDYNATIIYSRADSDGGAGFETLGAGFGAELGPWELNAYFVEVLDASGSVFGRLGEESAGLGLNVDLGGGAMVKLGVAETFASEFVSDFGVAMEF